MKEMGKSDFKKTNIFGKVNAGNDSTIVLVIECVYNYKFHILTYYY